MIKAIITDIEGTTSSIHFVKDVLFPYADMAMADFVTQHANWPDVAEQIHATRHVANEPDASMDRVIALLREWIKADKKITPLKALQGMIWDEGYAKGAFRSHMYPDAVTYLHKWHADSMPLYVYSSGSIQAQKLFFRHTEAGNLTPLISDYFDTTIGNKRETDSYRRIGAAINTATSEALFLSDIEAELDAAREAGMQTVWLVREGDVPNNPNHTAVTSFGDIRF